MSAPREVDVAVIGGGAAGIAAARAIAAAGRSLLLIEAGDRLGGRARTVAVEGLPLDLGCGWLHSADRNPLVRLAGSLGFAVDRSDSAWSAQWRGLGFPPAQQSEARAAFAAFTRRLHDAPPASDRAADALLPDCPWNGWLDALSSYMNGAEFGAISVADYLAYDDAATDENWRVPAGYGALIAAAGAALPVALGTRAIAIDEGGARLTVRLAGGGAIHARAAIVTLSTAVLARGDLRLPARLDARCHAAAALPLGLADKLFLAIDDAGLYEPETHLIGSPTRAATGSYYIRPFGRPLIECFFGGACAWDLERAGEGAAAAFATEELSALLGRDATRGLRPIAVTAWGAEPHVGGSYSHARPGHAGARAILAAPDPDGRIAFAGEACSARDFSTAHGAWASGDRAAREILAALA